MLATAPQLTAATQLSPPHTISSFTRRIDKTGDKRIDFSEFQKAFGLIKKQAVQSFMVKMGMTKGRIAFLLVYAVIVLLLVFIFIFLGVGAFTGASTISALVNSALTGGAGIAMNLKGDEEKKKPEIDAEDI